MNKISFMTGGRIFKPTKDLLKNYNYLTELGWYGSGLLSKKPTRMFKDEEEADYGMFKHKKILHEIRTRRVKYVSSIILCISVVIMTLWMIRFNVFVWKKCQ